MIKDTFSKPDYLSVVLSVYYFSRQLCSGPNTRVRQLTPSVTVFSGSDPSSVFHKNHTYTILNIMKTKYLLLKLYMDKGALYYICFILPESIIHDILFGTCFLLSHG